MVLVSTEHILVTCAYLPINLSSSNHWPRRCLTGSAEDQFYSRFAVLSVVKREEVGE